MGDAGSEALDIDIEIEDTTPATEGSPQDGTESNAAKVGQKRKDPEPCEKPDEEAFKKAQDKIKNELADVQKIIDDLTAKIDAACVTRQKFRDEAKAANDELQATTDLRRTNTEQIGAANAKYAELAARRKQQRSELDVLKQGLKFSSRVELEDAIVKIETQLASSNPPPAVRTKYMNDVALLKSQRFQTMRYEEQLAQTKMTLEDTSPLDEEKKAKRSLNQAIFSRSDAAFQQRETARKEAVKWNKDIEDQITKRKDILAQKAEIRKRQNDLSKAYQTQERAFERYKGFLEFKQREAARATRAAEKEARVAAAMQRAAERAERNAASGIVEEGDQTTENWSGDGVYKAADKAGKPAAPVVKRNNYDAQLGVIADLRRYLEFYKPKDAAGRTTDTSSQDSASSTVQPRREFNNEKKAVPLKKKSDIDDEWGSVIGTSKPAKAPRGEAPKPKKLKDTPVNHIPEALAKFKFVGVSPPLLSSQIELVLKQLEDQKSHYEHLPEKEAAEAEKKKAAKDASSSAADNELEEGEIVEADEGDDAEEPAQELSTAKAVAVTKEVLTSDAVEDLTTAFAAAAIQQVSKMTDAIAQADAAEEEESLTPEQAAAMAAMAEELGGVVDEAQAGLGDWVPPVAEKKPEHKEQSKEEKPKTEPKAESAEEEEEMTPEQAAAMAAMADELGEVVEEAQAGLGDWVPPVAEKKPEHKDEPTEKAAVEGEEEEEMTPEQAAAMAAMADELGEVVEQAQAGLGDWVPPVAEKKPEHKDEPAKPTATVAAVVSAEEEEMTPEQAAAMAAMADELGEVVEEAQAGLGDWVPPVAEKKAEPATALAEITEQTQSAIVAAVSKAVDVAVASTPHAAVTPAAAEAAEEAADEAEGEETPVTVKLPASADQDAEEVEYYEQVEIEEGDEQEGDEEVVENDQ